MKKVFYILFAGLLMLPIGCNEQNDSAPEPASDMIRFGVSQITSKVDFGTDPAGALNLSWEESDEIGISATKNDELFGCNYLYTISECSEDGSSATLEASSNLFAYRWAEGDYTFYAYYPFNGVQGAGVHYLTSISLPAEQYQQCVGDYSHLKELWAMKSEPYTISGEQNTVQLSFKGVYSIVELKLKYDAATAASRPVERVQLNSTVAPLAAENVNLMLDTDAATGDLIINEGEGLNSIDVILWQPFELSAEQTQSVWLLVIPAEHQAGEIGLQLQTNNFYRLDLTIPEAVNFEPNKVYRKEIVVNAEDFEYYGDEPLPEPEPEPTYEMITSASMITEGTYVILAKDSDGGIYYALPNETTVSNGANTCPAAYTLDAVSMTLDEEGNVVEADVADRFKWVITHRGETAQWDIRSAVDMTMFLWMRGAGVGVAIGTKDAVTAVNGNFAPDWTFFDDAEKGMQAQTPHAATKSRFLSVNAAAQDTSLAEKQWLGSSGATDALVLVKLSDSTEQIAAE